MIICHRHRFIFLANRKTASTSIAIALSGLCNRHDIVTPFLSKKEERVRRELGHQGPCNYIPRPLLPKLLYYKLSRRLSGGKHSEAEKHLGYYTHMTPEEVLRHLPRHTWDSYYKFCFVRNPWDRVISQYFWVHRDQEKPPMDAFIETANIQRLRDHSLAMLTLDGKMALDRLCRYEELESELNAVYERLGITARPALPHSKSGIRTDRRPYSEVLTAAQIQRIGELFHRELLITGYGS